MRPIQPYTDPAVHSLHRSLSVLSILTASLLLACGSERTSSGVWREVTCDDSNEVACHDTAYELHLGRYGRTLTGTVVRYRRQAGLDSLRRAYECGCFFIQGGRAVEDEFSFGLFEPDAQCEVTVDGVGRGQCRECECRFGAFVWSKRMEN